MIVIDGKKIVAIDPDELLLAIQRFVDEESFYLQTEDEDVDED